MSSCINLHLASCPAHRRIDLVTHPLSFQQFPAVFSINRFLPQPKRPCMTCPVPSPPPTLLQPHRLPYCSSNVVLPQGFCTCCFLGLKHPSTRPPGGWLCLISQAVLKSHFLSFIFFFLSFRAAPAAYGGSQVRGTIGAVATGLCQSHSTAGSEPRL